VTLSALTMLNKQLPNPTPTQQEVFNIALNGINRMQDLIDDLLNLEHIESGVDLYYDAFDMGALVRRSVAEMVPVVERREQSLTYTVPETPLVYVGDEQWLYRALSNLMSNAHKYTQTG